MTEVGMQSEGDQSEALYSVLDRRKALGRLGLYTAPAMVALLLSQRTAVASLPR
jgi:hypothetical protein